MMIEESQGRELGLIFDRRWIELELVDLLIGVCVWRCVSVIRFYVIRFGEAV